MAEGNIESSASGASIACNIDDKRRKILRRSAGGYCEVSLDRRLHFANEYNGRVAGHAEVSVGVDVVMMQVDQSICLVRKRQVSGGDERGAYGLLPLDG